MIRIILDNPTAEYTVGEEITGKIALQLSEAAETKGVFVKFFGDGFSCFTIGAKTHFESELYIDEKQCLCGDTNRQTGVNLTAGTHIWPFRYRLPLNLVSTFKKCNGRVRYYVDAEIDLPFKMDPTEKKLFVVRGIYDLNSQPAARMPATELATKNLCCWYCKSGPISALVRLPRTGFILGESIPISAEITNLSNEAMRTKALLEQKISFKAKIETKKDGNSEVITEVSKDEKIAAGDTGYWNEEALEIPKTIVPTNLGGSKVIQVQYFIKFIVDPDAIALPLELEIPLTIGTIPFALEDEAQAHSVTSRLPGITREISCVDNPAFVE